MLDNYFKKKNTSLTSKFITPRNSIITILQNITLKVNSYIGPFINIKSISFLDSILQKDVLER